MSRLALLLLSYDAATRTVTGHALSGMWIRFKVDPAAKSSTWATS